MADQKVTLRFAGKNLTCRPDTSIAVALWENGVRHLSHSPKYGLPRGVTCARGHCTACLMRVDGVPNVRVCETPVRDGMVIERQDAGAFYGKPLQRILANGGRLFPVGFYYKWFTRPPLVSRLFLQNIRPLAGVGRLPTPGAAPVDANTPPQATRDLGRYDTVVVGSGPAGMAAAAEATGRVLLLDDHDRPGGQRHAALAEIATIEGGLGRFPALAAWWRTHAAAAERLAGASHVDIRAGCRAVAGYQPDGLVLRQGVQLLTVAFKQLVWAAGALDVLGLFPGNDTPGLIGPRALYRLLTRDGLDVAGQDVLIIGGGLDFWLSAALLAHRGAHLNLVVEETGWQSEVSAAVDLNWQLTTGLRLSRLESRSADRLQATFVPRRSAPGPIGSRMELGADLVVVCQRGKPAYDIPYQLGVDLTLDPENGGFVVPQAAAGAPPAPWRRRLQAVGEASGALPATNTIPLGSDEPATSSRPGEA